MNSPFTMCLSIQTEFYVYKKTNIFFYLNILPKYDNLKHNTKQTIFSKYYYYLSNIQKKINCRSMKKDIKGCFFPQIPRCINDIHESSMLKNV